MTAAVRIYATARPSLCGAPVQSMDRTDRQFWTLRKQPPVSMREWLENRK